MIAQVGEAVGHAGDLMFRTGAAAQGNNAAVPPGVVPRVFGFIQAHPILLLPFGFYLVFMGIKTVRKLITGF